jgi:hydroxymethylpyrimidine pyrophosphatase-like HAD family hydrolase
MDNIQNDSRGTTAFPFRLAAIDLDGTLLGPDKTISPENIAAVDRLHQNGVTVIIADYLLSS